MNRDGIDPAALAIASLAAAVSVVAPPGPYGPSSLIIGGTILSVIIAFDKNPKRRGVDKFAFSAVCALISLLMLGYPMECLFAAVFPTDKSNLWIRLSVLFKEREDEIKYSQVPPFAAIIAWSGLVCAYYFLYPCRRTIHRLIKNDDVKILHL